MSWTYCCEIDYNGYLKSESSQGQYASNTSQLMQAVFSHFVVEFCNVVCPRLAQHSITHERYFHEPEKFFGDGLCCPLLLNSHPWPERMSPAPRPCCDEELVLARIVTIVVHDRVVVIPTMRTTVDEDVVARFKRR